jgi:hypothetical protein
MDWKNHVANIIGFILLAITILVYKLTQDSLDFKEVTIIILIGTLIFIVFTAIQNHFYNEPKKVVKKYDDLYIKLEDNIQKIIRTQQFIDQNTLKALEEKAQEVWVITTALDSEIKDSVLAETVDVNLERKKVTYTYFLPPKDSFFYRDHIISNIKEFKELDLYKNHKEKINFIYLPSGTQFLMKEVVIYNPAKDHLENDNDGINGFTYYESNELDKDGKKKILHMRIEGSFLQFLSKQLASYLDEEGLKIKVENLLIDYSNKLNAKQKLFLVDLMKEKRIKKTDYKNFINELDADKEISEILKNSLKSFVS